MKKNIMDVDMSKINNEIRQMEIKISDMKHKLERLKLLKEFAYSIAEPIQNESIPK